MQLRENAMRIVFMLAACFSIVAVFFICFYLFINGLPAIAEIGPLNFLGGMEWRPNNDIYGIFPMIIGSIYVTAGAIVVGVPIGILTAIYMAYFCPKKLYRIIKPAVELLAGIPVSCMAFFGLVVNRTIDSGCVSYQWKYRFSRFDPVRDHDLTYDRFCIRGKFAGGAGFLL